LEDKDRGCRVKNGLFHKSLGFPAGALQPWVGKFSLTHTAHSRSQCGRPETGSARKGGSFLIDVREGDPLAIGEADIFEVEVEGGRPVKALVRLEYNDDQDVVLALCAPEGKLVRCKTLWLNAPNDQHKTLKTQYVKP
jgi:hypothetical protein